MSNNFINFTAVPFSGSGNLQGRDVGICTPSTYNPRVVPIEIDWLLYPTAAVLVDLTAGGVAPPIDRIRSVIIDNEGQVGAV